MSQIELTVIVDPVPSSTVDRIHEHHDAFTFTHCGLMAVTVTADGDDALAVAQRVVGDLESIPDVRVTRVCENLVDLDEVADRAQVSRDTVSGWLRDTAGTQRPFPAAHHPATGGLWLWEEVNSWLREAGEPSSPARCLTHAETVQVNTWLAQRSCAN